MAGPWVAHNIWDHTAQFGTAFKDLTFPEDSGCALTYRFTVAEAAFDDVSPTLELAVERPQLYTITVNGNPVDFAAEGERWFDEEMRKVSIAGLVRPGENEIDLRIRPFSPFCEIMAVYLLGDFALEPVEKGFRVERPRPLTLGDWREQGMLFYAEDVIYRYPLVLKEDANVASLAPAGAGR